eukprot:GHVL01038387.1.p1 GENE.GHVL01038387.1~~GHVL01038387.1.p1  ORF type:complete len:604 (+),score=127.52 GHVL01038387.1:65-1876(+)
MDFIGVDRLPLHFGFKPFQEFSSIPVDDQENSINIQQLFDFSPEAPECNLDLDQLVAPTAKGSFHQLFLKNPKTENPKKKKKIKNSKSSVLISATNKLPGPPHNSGKRLSTLSRALSMADNPIKNGKHSEIRVLLPPNYENHETMEPTMPVPTIIEKLVKDHSLDSNIIWALKVNNISDDIKVYSLVKRNEKSEQDSGQLPTVIEEDESETGFSAACDGIISKLSQIRRRTASDEVIGVVDRYKDTSDTKNMKPSFIRSFSSDKCGEGKKYISKNKNSVLTQNALIRRCTSTADLSPNSTSKIADYFYNGKARSREFTIFVPSAKHRAAPRHHIIVVPKMSSLMHILTLVGMKTNNEDLVFALIDGEEKAMYELTDSVNSVCESSNILALVPRTDNGSVRHLQCLLGSLMSLADSRAIRVGIEKRPRLDLFLSSLTEASASLAKDFDTVATCGQILPPRRCKITIELDRLTHELQALPVEEMRYLELYVHEYRTAAATTPRFWLRHLFGSGRESTTGRFPQQMNEKLSIEKKIQEIRCLRLLENNNHAFEIIYSNDGSWFGGDGEAILYEAASPTQCAQICARIKFIMELGSNPVVNRTSAPV